MQSIDNNIITDVATRIERLITDARANVARAVNLTEVITKYEIGHVIVSVVQEGEVRAAYGKQLLKGVSRILTERLGDGWSVDTLEKCRKFYHAYSKSATLSRKFPNAITSDENLDNSEKSATSLRKLAKLPETYPFTLSWSHYLILMRIESDEERRFYEIEAQKQNWSVRQLQRQYSSSLYERLALSRNKDEVMRLAQEGHTINKPVDILKIHSRLNFSDLNLMWHIPKPNWRMRLSVKCSTSCLNLAKDFYSKPAKSGLHLMRMISLWILYSIIDCCNVMS